MIVLQMSFSASVLIIIITIMRAVLIHKLPKKTFIFLWGAVLFRLLVPVSIPFALSVYSWIPQNSTVETEQLQNIGLQGISVISGTAAENFSGKYNVDSFFPVFKRLSISLWTTVWAIGFMLFLCFFLFAYYKCIKKFKKSLPIETSLIKEWKKNHPLKRTLSIRISEQIFTPLSYGIFKPVILLPKKLDLNNKKVLNYVLTHEYVHIKHFDILTKILMILALSIHWFNPIVWSMYLLLNRDIELVCDETIVRMFGEQNKSIYAHVLIDMEIQKSGFMPFCNNFSKIAIEERISAIMKTKKVTVFSIVFAGILIIGLVTVFATSGVSKKNQFVRSILSAEEFDQILALKFTGYEKMSISEYQDKVWTITDTEEYQKLLSRVFNDDSLYEQKDSDAVASFLFNELEPLTSERWQEKQFRGYMQKNYNEATDNPTLEYSFTMTIKNPHILTVGEYNKIRLEIKNELNGLIQNNTLKELQDETSMNNIIQSKIEKIEKCYNSDKLKVVLEYHYKPLAFLKTDTINETPIKEEESEYRNATSEDYKSLLTLKTQDYQTMTVSNFNKILLEWANEDYDRSERIATNIVEDYEISLSKEEKNFIDLTVWASSIENAEFVKSQHTTLPEQNPILTIELPGKENYFENKIYKWCKGSYQLSYYIENKDTLSIGERDYYLSNILFEIQRFWNDTEIQEMIKMNRKGLEKKFSEIAIQNSNEKITFIIVEGQVYFEHSVN